MCSWKQTPGHPPLWGERLRSELAEPRLGEGDAPSCFLPHLDAESVFLKQHRTKHFLCSATQPVVAAWSAGSSCVWASAEESSRCTMRRRAEAAWLNLKGRPPALRGRASNGTPPPGLRWGQHRTPAPRFPFPEPPAEFVLPRVRSAPRRAALAWGWGMWNVTRAGSWSEAATRSPNRCPNRPAPCRPAPRSHQVNGYFLSKLLRRSVITMKLHHASLVSQMRAARIALLPTVCWRWRSTCAATGTTVKPAATRAAPYDPRPPNAGLHILSLHPDSNLSSRKGPCPFRDMTCVSMSSQLEAFYLFHRCRGYSNWFDCLKDGVLYFLLAVSSIYLLMKLQLLALLHIITELPSLDEKLS